MVLSLVPSKPIINLLPTQSAGENNTIALFGANNSFCSMANDISEEEAQQKLQQLLQEFSSIFNSEDKSPAKTPVIDIPLKYEYKDKIFFRPEPLRSQRDQDIN